MATMLKFICIALLGYCAFLTYIYLNQRNLIYLPDKNSPDQIASNAGDMQQITLHTEDGLELFAWYKAAKNNLKTIVYFHGNAGHIGHRVPLIRPYLDAGYGVLLVEYRGYGSNPGIPSEQGLYEDARAAMNYLLTHQVKPNQIVLFGESLGTAVAIQMATEFPIAILVLRSPYTSLSDVAAYHYKFLPVRWLLKDRYESINLISQVHAPLLVIHGLQDKIIPVQFVTPLLNAANTPKQRVFLEKARHNQMPDISQTVIQFLETFMAP